jgi:hypothetical protein
VNASQRAALARSVRVEPAAAPAPKARVLAPAVAPPRGLLRRIEVTFSDAARGEECMRAVRSRRVGPTAFVGTWEEGAELASRSYVAEVMIRRVAKAG